jgi:enamine deaminase RidA (YjgF/YER057c/UK114 family)
MGEAIRPAELPEWPGQAYSDGYRVGNLLWIAGQTALDANNEVVGVGDPRAQAARIFERIGIILREAGGTPQDLTMIRSYVTDIRHQGAMREARAAFLGQHRPASTGVQVAALARPEFLMEIEAMAVIGQSRGAAIG